MERIKATQIARLAAVCDSSGGLGLGPFGNLIKRQEPIDGRMPGRSSAVTRLPVWGRSWRGTSAAASLQQFCQIPRASTMCPWRRVSENAALGDRRDLEREIVPQTGRHGFDEFL
jgi:hypothetical protein